jgi:hypothetical protein
LIFHKLKGNQQAASNALNIFFQTSFLALPFILANPLANALFFSTKNIVTQSCSFLGLILGSKILDLSIFGLGFGRDGIRKGSWASSWSKSFKGNIPKDSFFSRLQTIGRKGVPFSLGLSSAVFFMIAFGILVVLIWNQFNPEDNCDAEEEQQLLRPASPASID